MSAFAQSKQIVPSSKDTTLLFVDLSKLSPQDAGRVFTAFAKLSTQHDATINHTITAQDQLNLIIKKTYNYTDSLKHHITSAIKNFISRIHRLDPKSTLIKGNTISIPKLPVASSKDGSTIYTQFFDIYANKSYLSATDSLATYTLSKFVKPVDFNKGGLIAYKLDKNDLKQFKSLVSDSVYNKNLGKSIVPVNPLSFVEINYLKGDNSLLHQKDSTTFDSTMLSTLRKIDTAYFLKYYVFDYFNGKIDHGKKVLDVIASRFKQFGLDTSMHKIIPVPVNYFQNKEASLQFLENYYRLPQTVKKQRNIEDLPGVSLIKSLKNFDGEKYKDCETCIPEGFLNAMFNYYYSLKPSIISTSFTALTENNITPQFIETNTSLLTAGLNEDGNIESLLQRDRAAGEHLRFQQPLVAYLNSYPNAGCIIVGNRLTAGKFAGLHSLEGDKITTLGQGIGWGNYLTTIKPKDTGSSFATPDVAAQLYIAKAYWLSQKISVNSIQARIRLLLATDIDSSFVGKFASGGVVNIKKLLQKSKGYAEMANGDIVPITFKPGVIAYNDFSQCPLQRDSIIKGRKLEGICGLTVIGTRFYAFAEHDLCWKQIDINTIKLQVTANNRNYSIQNTVDFSNNFKQIILLNNPQSND